MDEVEKTINMIKNGVAKELGGLNPQGGALVLRYAVELMEKWAAEGHKVLDAEVENGNREEPI